MDEVNEIIQINNDKCIVCNKYKASYGYRGKVPECCKRCKKDDMKIYKSRCKKCRKYNATFGYIGKKAEYCKSCKTDEMIDIKSKKCIKCNKNQPSFGYKNGKREYCLNCKTDEMIDIRHPKCIVCKIERPFYSYKGQKANHCRKCKLEDMENFMSPRCIKCSIKQCTYGIEGEKAKYCKKCKDDKMIDLINPRCIKCKISRPNFGYKGDKPEYCGKCKLKGMKNHKIKLCIICNETQCTYGYKNNLAEYCLKCKLPHMIDVKHPKCKSEWCETRITDKYEGYCFYCFIHLFPDKAIVKNYKTKEKATIEYIKNEFTNIDIIFDKKIINGCSRRRPDVFIDLGYQVIIVEIDENQHIDYDCSCENKRIMELSQDVNHRPIIFIRFNPDDYIKDDDNITSCWSINKLGICSIKKSKQKEWNERLNCLKDSIEYWLNPCHITDKTVETIELYYDQ